MDCASTQLNLQLIHAIDFLPPGCWKRTSNDYFFGLFVTIHELLTRNGQLRASVGWDPGWMQPLQDSARPNTWRHWVVDMVPTAVARTMAASQMGKFSAAIGHSLEYELLWEEGVTSRL